MVTLQFADDPPVNVASCAMRRLALYAAEACEARSIVERDVWNADLLKEVQNVHDWAEFVYHRLTGENLPTTPVGPTNQGGR